MTTTNRPTGSAMRELAQHRVQNLKIVPPGAEMDPMKDAEQDVRTMLAANMREHAIASQRVELRKAEAEEKRAELELRKLEREGSTISEEMTAFQAYLIDQLRSVQSELGTVQRSLSERERADMEGRLLSLTEELQSLRGALANPQPQNALVTLKDQLSDAQAMMELIKELSPQEPAPPLVRGVDDPGFVAWARTMDFRMEQWRAEREDAKASRDDQRALERYKVEEELSLKREQMKIYNRAIEETAPKLLAMFTEVVQMFRDRPAAAAQAEPASAPVAPPGAQSQPCSRCGTVLFYFDEDAPYRFACPTCGAVYNVSKQEETHNAPDRNGYEYAESDSRETPA